MTECCLTVEEYMTKYHFSRQDIFALFDSLISRYGTDATPDEIVEQETERLKKIRIEKSKGHPSTKASVS